jgi:hypothetical protein
VDTIFRQIEWSARGVIDRFGANAGPRITKAAADDPDRLVKIVHGACSKGVSAGGW